MLIGLISDTHGRFDPQIPDLFRGVDHILHAGDICGNEIIVELERIAPVTAVLGNNDYDPQYRELEVVELGGMKFLVHHIVRFDNLHAPIFESVQRVRPDMVIYGHTHRPDDRTVAGVRYINPGYTGPQRFSMRRTLATLRLNGGDAELVFHDL